MIKDLPKKLKEQRLFLGYSQREVAQKLSVSPAIISGYETGERTPSLQVLLALSYIYRCSLDFLLSRETKSPQANINVEGLTEKQIHLLLDLVDELKKSNGKDASLK